MFEPIRPADIAEGTLIWYSGTKGKYSWHCPGQIFQVDRNKGTFRVTRLSLDRYEDVELYRIEPGQFAPHARHTMRLASEQEVRAYRDEQRARHEQRVTAAEAELREAKAARDKGKEVWDVVFPTIPA